MEIKIAETGKIETLELIDPNTKTNWIEDLMGNHNSLPAHNGDYYVMAQADFDWWADLVERYQAADDRYNDLVGTLADDDKKALIEEAHNINCDLENFPEALEAVCDRFDE